jgi:hypothetical protein
VVVVRDGALPVELLPLLVDPSLEVAELLLADVLPFWVACWAARVNPAVAATADRARPVVTAVARRRPSSRLVISSPR